MAAPDKASLLEFTPKAAAEIKQNTFVATSGGLVNLSAPTFWEMYYGAKAWHEHLAETGQKKHAPCIGCLGTGRNLMHDQPCASCDGMGRANTESAVATAT